MFYLENYGPYSTLIDNKSIIIENTSINAQTWETHFVSILNIQLYIKYNKRWYRNRIYEKCICYYKI